MSSITEDAQDDAVLEQLGYKQELRRGMTLLCVTLCAVHMQLFISRALRRYRGSIGITLGCMQPLLSGGVFQLGMLYGGACCAPSACRSRHGILKTGGRAPRHSGVTYRRTCLRSIGPAVVIYGFLGCWLFATPMVFSMVRASRATVAARVWQTGLRLTDWPHRALLAHTVSRKDPACALAGCLAHAMLSRTA
jgi:hypothetical protein